MAVTVYLPYALRHEYDPGEGLAITATSVRGALEELERTQPALYRNLCDETGAVRRHINLFVNRVLIRERQGLETPLEPGDELFILTAVSGG